VVKTAGACACRRSDMRVHGNAHVREMRCAVRAAVCSGSGECPCGCTAARARYSVKCARACPRGCVRVRRRKGRKGTRAAACACAQTMRGIVKCNERRARVSSGRKQTMRAGGNAQALGAVVFSACVQQQSLLSLASISSRLCALVRRRHRPIRRVSGKIARTSAVASAHDVLSIFSVVVLPCSR